MSGKKVVVGMSGGVDSSVAAYLLKKQGYEVAGVTMQTRGHNEQEAIDDAKKVAEALGIEHYAVDFGTEFKKYVMDYFAEEYALGRTPNPCVVCNRRVKWASLMAMRDKLGADYVATGHYATIEICPDTGRRALKFSKTQEKDQTYALNNLTQDQLAVTLMPLGEYEKSQTRKIAKEIGLAVADKKDSQDICFIPDNDYVGFLSREYNMRSVFGNFVDVNGAVLGEHKGIIRYTVGQRKGLGVAFGKPMYVKELRAESNEVVLCDNENLFSKTLYASDLNFMSLPDIKGEKRLKAKIRYSHRPTMCAVKLLPNGVLECVFDEPQRAITPGQSVVFYDGDYVACGAKIISGGL